MKLKIDYWKNSGKWYTSETTEVQDFNEIDLLMSEPQKFLGMTATVLIIEEDGHEQPYRLYRL